ncbi:hypothetical protein [Qipengyuania nanhaisediminis]|uniref:hypothetical protein n=1 Tax=Qipengyuania nanhaisediminis TaxID=604088 RepID=UPI0038B3E5E2
MALFTPDLYRNFAIGFAAGAMVVGVTALGQSEGGFEAPAHAAQPAKAPQSAGAFTIAPLDEAG